MLFEIEYLIAPTKKLDRAIELLIHYNLTLIEIVYQLNYRSIEEFRSQFREWVGYSPEDFRKMVTGS
jgi:AraC-like DNA-binding protein